MAKPIKPLQQQIDEYKDQPQFKDRKTRFGTDVKATWNWDESWDGQLIRDVIALDKAGFTVVNFSRKRKVTLQVSRFYQPVIELANNSSVEVDLRTAIVSLIVDAVGDNWYSISFKPTLSIYWKGRSGTWNR